MADLNDKVSAVQNQAMYAVDSMSRAVGSWKNSADVNVAPAERLLSVVGGVLLFGWGVYRRGLLGYGAMAAATALWDRGVRGHCGLYAALGKTSVDEGNQGDGALRQALP